MIAPWSSTSKKFEKLFVALVNRLRKRKKNESNLSKRFESFTYAACYFFLRSFFAHSQGKIRELEFFIIEELADLADFSDGEQGDQDEDEDDEDEERDGEYERADPYNYEDEDEDED